MDIDHLKSWIGREQVAADIITPGLFERFVKTLGRPNDERAPLPPGIHWCLSPPAVSMDEIGADGHPKKGDFLPPVPLAYRMWASGKITFLQPLRLGQTLTRRSEILNVTLKEGTAGALVFVDIGHYLSEKGVDFLHEKQTLVYKSVAGVAPPQMADEPEILNERTLHPDSVLLFRYSALTFNGHRIHYDFPYAREVEGYPDLVVHGPMIATFLMHFAVDCMPARRLSAFEFRGVAPAFSGRALRLIATRADDALALQARGEDGRLVMKAVAEFSDAQ